MTGADIEALKAAAEADILTFRFLATPPAILELIAQRAALVEKLERLSRDHYDDDGVIDLRSAYLIVGRDSTGSLQLKGSFIARLEEARALLSTIQAGGAK